MNFSKENMLLYAVTDRAWTGTQTLYEQVEAALKGGVTLVQLREKNLDYDSFLKEAIELKALCSRYNVPLIINDNVDIAIKSGADGIHVGQKDMEAGDVRALVGKDMIIGVTAKTIEQAIAAEKAGANYLGTGAAFGSVTKSDATAISHEAIQDICKAVSIPVVAIGGIDKFNILKLAGRGIDGVALVSAIFAAEDIEQECKELRTLSEKIIHS
ncbi:MAG: thiamine phosphate synthase [Lachnospiraceae bacterium]|nr:thiamine phosphate synthase [Lachnospiraceae bacterium]